MAKYELSTIELLEEGRFLEDLRKAYRKIQTELRYHESQYGHATNKGSAKLTVTLGFSWAKPSGVKDSVFYAEGKLAIALPGTPAIVNLCLPLEDDNDVPGLFMQASGGRKETPRQSRLCTHDGRTVDPETGEVLEKSDALS